MLSWSNGDTGQPSPVGAKRPLDTQAIRDRLAMGQKEADRSMPQVLDAYALFLTVCHDDLTGRLPGVCFAIKSDAKKVGEALRGDLAITLFTVFKMLDHIPHVIIPAFGWVFSRYGYRVVRDSGGSSPVSEREAIAGLVETAAEVEAEAVRALTNDHFDPRFKRRIRHGIDRVERALVNFRPYVEVA